MFAVVASLGLFGLPPIDSFGFSPPSNINSHLSLEARSSIGSECKLLPTSILMKPTSRSSFVLKNSKEDGNSEPTAGSPISTDAVLGIAASMVVLYSEYTLKTTGCGLPAGPFGIVGAVEGLSYLGVVGICANAVSQYFSDEGGNRSDTSARRIATTLGLSAALVGIAVLGFQVIDYGYIPNAVPMEGGMCK